MKQPGSPRFTRGALSSVPHPSRRTSVFAPIIGRWQATPLSSVAAAPRACFFGRQPHGFPRLRAGPFDGTAECVPKNGWFVEITREPVTCSDGWNPWSGLLDNRLPTVAPPRNTFRIFINSDLIRVLGTYCLTNVIFLMCPSKRRFHRPKWFAMNRSADR
jgi:hypothetical protein